MLAQYSCFVETCAEKRKTPVERRAHLIETHKYPANYFFAVTKAGVDRRQSMLVNRNESKPRTNQRDNAHQQGRKGGKKRSGKDATPGVAGVNGFQKSATTDDGAAELVDVAMGDPDNPASQDQLNNDGGKDNNKRAASHDVAALVGSSGILPKHQAVQDHKTAAHDTDMEQLTGAMSSLKFVPRNVRLASKKSGLPPR